jgi:molybdenum cofactor biosynthesis protein MoaF
MDQAEAIKGKTIRLAWTEGPTRGMTHEHVFYQDGTVEWHDAKAAGQGGPAKERPPYAAVEVADGVYAVSYLAASGYTLTVVLNFRDQNVIGFASSAKDWHHVRGRFEVVR